MTLYASYTLEFDWDGDGAFDDEVDVYDDLVLASITRGHSGPLARVATVSRATLLLLNSDKAYSPPLEADVRPRRGVRLRMTYGGTTKTLYQGYITSIRPTFSENRERRVAFECVDAMDLLDRYEGPIGLLEDTTADAIIEDAVEAVYTPATTNYEAGINVFPFSSDRWEIAMAMVAGGMPSVVGESPRVRASQKIVAACVADWGRFFISSAGVPTFYNRHHMPTDTTTALTLDDTMLEMGYSLSDTGIYNHVAVTCHPRSVGETYEVLGRISQRDAPMIDPAASETFTLYFRDPSNPALRLGGKGATVVSGTDLVVTDDPAGEGNSVLADVAVLFTAYGDRVDVTLTNNGAVPAYVQTLQARGIAIRVRDPMTVVAQDAGSITEFERRELPLDAALMSTQVQAQGLADHLLDYYHDPLHDVRGVDFYANSSATFMAAARDLELCDRIVLTESQTGLSSQALHIYAIRHTITPGRIHRVSLDLEQAYAIGGVVALVDDAHVDGPEVVIY